MGVPVGFGGAGAKVGPDGEGPSKDASLSQKIGDMVEESRQGSDHGGAAEKQPVRRADGTVLQEKGDKPRNPKKKMWEEDVEAAKYEARKRDEL